MILAAGSWLSRLVPELRLPLTVERQVLHWFRPLGDPRDFAPDRCPVFLWELSPGDYFYGFPDLGKGVKVAGHHGGVLVDPETIEREVSSVEVHSMRVLLRRFVPAADGEHLASEVCMYTNTPDGHFVIDVHPQCPQVLLVSPCSGHGFKFSSVIGEIVADQVMGCRNELDLSLFRNRFLDTPRPAD
jgi:sarcosine oxidase